GVGTFSFGGGAGGAVRLNATGTLSLLGEGTSLVTVASGTGAGGPLSVSAGTLLMNGANVQARSESAGRGGDVGIDVGRLAMSAGAAIQTNANGSERGGDISITAAESVSISGRSSLNLR